ncbi:hypothetical protein SAMN04489867_1867 [Pedococcus dokdonensis]|uniref:LysM domain-containing protein n=1 Tax=Pedococcus dokdonensis TaxID=443156 RepID=A0A1H0R780_9MICO|nr:hypothetical protein SAMN04489867_1867 [Pedococcus dokdonensis]
MPPASGPGFALTRPISPDPASRPLDAAGPGWTPSRPTHQAPDATRLVAGAGARPAGEVVVHRGDSLWSIVRRTLGPGASDAEVAAVWPRWHAANRDVVGPDPDRLLPGQVLRPPEPAEQPAQPDGVSR